MKVGHYKFQAPPQGYFFAENKKPITIWVSILVSVIWIPYWFILHWSLNLILGVGLIGGILSFLYLKHKEFVAKQLYQRETKLVEIVYLAEGDAATQAIVKSLEKEAQNLGFLTEILSGQQFVPSSMLSGAVIVIFVVNDELLSKDPLRKFSFIEDFLYEEAEIRIHEGAFNGHRLNIVYTEEGRRRRGFLRVKYAVVGNAKAVPMCGCSSATSTTTTTSTTAALNKSSTTTSADDDNNDDGKSLSISQHLQNYLWEFNAFPLIERCESFENCQEWTKELWKSVIRNSVMNHQKTRTAERLLGFSFFFQWLFSCHCCDQLTIEKTRQRASPWTLNNWEFYSQIWKGSKSTLDRHLFANLDDKKWFFETNTSSATAVRRFLFSQMNGWWTSFHHIFLLFPYRLLQHFFHHWKIHLPHPLRHHFYSSLPTPTTTTTTDALPDSHVSKALFLPWLIMPPVVDNSEIPSKNTALLVDFMPTTTTTTTGKAQALGHNNHKNGSSGSNDGEWMVNPNYHLCSNHKLLPNGDYFPFVLEWIHRISFQLTTTTTTTPTTSSSSDSKNEPQVASSSSSSLLSLLPGRRRPRGLVEVKEVGTEMKHYYLVTEEQRMKLKDLKVGENVKMSWFDTESWEALLKARVIIPKDSITLQSQEWNEIIKKGRTQMKTKGYFVFEEIINPMMFDHFQKYCKDLHFRLGGTNPKEYITYNDEPVSRYFSHQLTFLVEKILELKVIPSSLPLIIWNGPGSGFFLHQDSSPPFDITLDLVVDHIGPHSRTLNFISKDSFSSSVQLETLSLRVGQSAIFRGAEKWHFGGPLPPGHWHTVVLFTWQLHLD